MIGVSRVAVGGETTLVLPFTFTPGMELLRVTVNGEPRAFSETNTTTIGFASALAAGDRVEVRSAGIPSLHDSIPQDWRTSDTDGVLAGFVEVLDSALTEIVHDLRSFPRVRDWMACDTKYLPHLAASLGWDLDTPAVSPLLPATTERKIVGLIVPLYKRKGTRAGMVAILRLFLGLECTVFAARSDAWLLGVHRLGFGTILAPDFETAPGESLSLHVQFPQQLLATERTLALQLLELMKPAKARLLIEEPTLAVGWRLGASRLGWSAWGVYFFQQILHAGEVTIRLPIPIQPTQDRLIVKVNGVAVAFVEGGSFTIDLGVEPNEGDVLTIEYRGSTVLG